MSELLCAFVFMFSIVAVGHVVCTNVKNERWMSRILKRIEDGE